MAERLGVDHQGLQQFVSSSTWDVRAVRSRIAAKAVEVIQPVAWVIDDTGFPKDGKASPGVARQYSGTLGKVGNCQIGVSVHAVTDTASCPLDWRLFLPGSWDTAVVENTLGEGVDEAERERRLDAVRLQRRRAGIPDELGHQPKWRLALEMLDELNQWGLRPPVIAADAGYGNNAHFRDALTTSFTMTLGVCGSRSARRPAAVTPGADPRGPRSGSASV
jgi:SRSO17 transposase